MFVSSQSIERARRARRSSPGRLRWRRHAAATRRSRVAVPSARRVPRPASSAAGTRARRPAIRAHLARWWARGVVASAPRSCWGRVPRLRRPAAAAPFVTVAATRRSRVAAPSARRVPRRRRALRVLELVDASGRRAPGEMLGPGPATSSPVAPASSSRGATRRSPRPCRRRVGCRVAVERCRVRESRRRRRAAGAPGAVLGPWSCRRRRDLVDLGPARSTSSAGSCCAFVTRSDDAFAAALQSARRVPRRRRAVRVLELVVAGGPPGTLRGAGPLVVSPPARPGRPRVGALRRCRLAAAASSSRGATRRSRVAVPSARRVPRPTSSAAGARARRRQRPPRA